MAEQIKRPRGTTDWYGKEGVLLEEVKDLFLHEASLYGASYVELPVFEESHLFHRTVGESSDIVRKETFDLVSKGDKDYTLRPEFTAGVNRLIIENKLYASPDLPLRYSYFGPVFRYERPQSGRLRQFYQYGVEFLDNKIDIDTTLDAFLLSIRSTKKALNRDCRAKINYLGSFESRENYKKALRGYFEPIIDTMCDDCKNRLQTNPLRILDCKVPEDQEIAKGAPRVRDYLSEDDRKDFENICRKLDENGIDYEIDDGLVRGLDYYTGLVWEIYDATNPSFPALGGGGKYSSLMRQIGGPDFEGIGFSLGVDRIILCMSQERKDELTQGHSVDVMIIDQKKDGDAARIGEKLRNLDVSVTIASLAKAMGGAFKMADRLGAKYVIISGEDGLQLKDLAQREQKSVTEEELIEFFGSK